MSSCEVNVLTLSLAIRTMFISWVVLYGSLMGTNDGELNQPEVLKQVT